ncbi:hypothetical protein [Glutamicibacter uratoxydans]|uniref:hypothetical protein n=1 Tax=Glutamicibacter uratoxydans TaxID=43667 RepID=UPI003D701716
MACFRSSCEALESQVDSHIEYTDEPTEYAQVEPCGAGEVQNQGFRRGDGEIFRIQFTEDHLGNYAEDGTITNESTRGFLQYYMDEYAGFVQRVLDAHAAGHSGNQAQR